MKTIAVDLVAKLMESCPQIPADIDPEILADAIAVAVSCVIEQTSAESEAEAIEKQLAADCAEAIRFLTANY